MSCAGDFGAPPSLSRRPIGASGLPLRAFSLDRALTIRAFHASARAITIVTELIAAVNPLIFTARLVMPRHSSQLINMRKSRAPHFFLSGAAR